MKLSEYIEKREQTLENQLEKIMEQDVINALAVSVVNASLTELGMIRIAIEDGKIEGD